MRQIKFRAWDNERKQMVNYVPILILCDNSIWPHDLGYFHNSQQWTTDEGLITDYVLMQFTGLLDKNENNTCIYEGDIISLQGKLIGNKYETPEILKDKTNLLIEGIGTKTWAQTENEGLARGLYYAE